MEKNYDELAQMILVGKSGNKEAQAQLLTRYGPIIRNIASPYGELDNDCYQELAKEFLQLLERFTPEKYLNNKKE